MLPSLFCGLVVFEQSRLVGFLYYVDFNDKNGGFYLLCAF